MSNSLVPMNDIDLSKLGELARRFHQSNLFNLKSENEAFVKLLAGAELGCSMIESMTNLYVTNGMPNMDGRLLARRARNAGFTWKILEHTDNICRLEWSDPNGERVGESSMTYAECEKAGFTSQGRDGIKHTWKTQSKMMLFHRAISQGVRLYCPEVGGAFAYDKDEASDVADLNRQMKNVTPPDDIGLENEVIDIEYDAQMAEEAERTMNELRAFREAARSLEKVEPAPAQTMTRRKAIFEELADLKKQASERVTAEFRKWFKSEYGSVLSLDDKCKVSDDQLSDAALKYQEMIHSSEVNNA